MVTKYLPRYGISSTLVPAGDNAAWEAAVQPNTKMVYLETPTNPQLEVLDLEWIGQFSKKHGLILNVDNCFATPLLQTPIEFGADLGGTFGHKMDRRAGQGIRWRYCWPCRSDKRNLSFLPQYRAVHVAV